VESDGFNLSSSGGIALRGLVDDGVMGASELKGAGEGETQGIAKEGPCIEDKVAALELALRQELDAREAQRAALRHKRLQVPPSPDAAVNSSPGAAATTSHRSQSEIMSYLSSNSNGVDGRGRGDSGNSGGEGHKWSTGPQNGVGDHGVSHAAPRSPGDVSREDPHHSTGHQRGETERLRKALRDLRDSAQAELMSKHERISGLEESMRRAAAEADDLRGALANEMKKNAMLQRELDDERRTSARLKRQGMLEDGHSLLGDERPPNHEPASAGASPQNGNDFRSKWLGQGSEQVEAVKQDSFKMKRLGMPGSLPELGTREADSIVATLALQNAVATIDKMFEFLAALQAPNEMEENIAHITAGIRDVASMPSVAGELTKKEVMPMALALLQKAPCKGDGSETACAAVSVVCSLSSGRDAMSQMGAGAAFATSLINGERSPSFVWRALHALASLTLISEVREELLDLRIPAVESHAWGGEGGGSKVLMSKLVSFLGSGQDRIKTQACLVIGNLAVEDAWRSIIAKDPGSLDGILEAFTTSDQSLRQKCLGLVRNLSVDPACKMVIAKRESVVNVLNTERKVGDPVNAMAAHWTLYALGLEEAPRAKGSPSKVFV